MGAARGNPRSSQFRGAITGDLPRLSLEAEFVAEVLPSAEWVEANRPAEGKDWPIPPMTSLVVHYRIKTAALFPSRLVIPADWPSGEAITGEIDSMGLPEVMAHLLNVNPHLKPAWAQLVREDVARAEGATPPDEPK